MKKGILLFLTILTLFMVIGCEAENGMVETNAEFEPYWWRNDPFYDDKDIDEEATNALGDPNVVIIAGPPRSPRDLMFDRIAAKIVEVYGLSMEEDVYQIANIMFYHADTMRSWELQGVDWILFDAEMQKARQSLPVFPPHDLCVCPVIENSEADCLQDGDKLQDE